jgi:hypothetical protein
VDRISIKFGIEKLIVSQFVKKLLLMEPEGVRRNPLLVPDLSQMNPIHIFQAHNRNVMTFIKVSFP